MNKDILVTALLLSACSVASSNRLYVGPLAPLSGTCDRPAQAQLLMRGNAVLFAPTSGTVVLSGTNSGGKIMATYATIGAERKPYFLMFVGALRGSKITGIYHDARCRYGVSLHSASS